MMFLLVLILLKCFWELIGLLSSYHNRDDLLFTLKVSQRFYNSDLWHLRSSSDSKLPPAPEALQSSLASDPLLAISNTAMCSFHPNTSPNTSSSGSFETSTSSEGNSETSSNSAPSNLNSAPTFFGYSQGHSGDGVAPATSDIKGHVIGVICNIKGQGWSGSMGNARWWC